MIGDSSGDRAAAEANGALFFPVIPGRETESWRELSEAGLDRFFGGTYAGAYQEHLLYLFQSSLLATPPWEAEPPLL